MQPYINKISRFFYNRNIGLLLIRMVTGAIFLSHGLAKVSDLSATITYFDTLGVTPLIALTIAWLEILGGVSLVLGIAPRILGGMLGIEMLVAAILISGTEGIAAAESQILLSAVAFGIMLLGSGRYALYKMECNQYNGLFCIKKNRVCVMSV